MIKLLILVVLLALSPLSMAVHIERQDVNGYTYIRLVNDYPFTINCVIQDQIGNYYPSWIYPNRAGRWYRVFGKFSWICGK